MATAGTLNSAVTTALAAIGTIDPAGLDDSLAEYHEAPAPFFGGLSRMVNRNDRAVAATAIGGKVVFRHGEFIDGYGRSAQTGRYLKAGEKRPAVGAKR